MKKAKIIIYILIFILVGLLITGGYFIYSSLIYKTNDLNDEIIFNNSSQTKPDKTVELSDINFDLADYRVYKMDGIPFNFVIAKIRVNTVKSTNIDLSHFTTDENIKLSEVDKYVTQLEEKSYYLGKQNVVFSLISNENQYFANIFIPVVNKSANEIKLNNDIDNKEMTFNLATHRGDFKQLIYKADDVISDGKTYQMKVSEAFPITGEYLREGQGEMSSEYLLPSTVEVYAFKLETVSLWGDKIELESAQYVSEQNEIFDALGSSINSEKHDNILGKVISDSDTGYLFFVAYSPIDNPITYKGVLKLKIKGSDSWITVNVNLN